MIDTGDDCNDYIESSVWRVKGTATNAAYTAGHNMMVIKGNGIQQIAFSTDNNCLYFRSSENGDIWNSWTKISYGIPDYYKSYSDLASLASALGVPVFSNIGESTTLSELQNGCYQLQQGQFATDGPSGLSSSTSTFMYLKTTNSELLFPIDASSNVWYSRYSNNNWIERS